MKRDVYQIDHATYGVESPSGEHDAIVRNLACGNEPPRWKCSCSAGARGQRCKHIVAAEAEVAAAARDA